MGTELQRRMFTVHEFHRMAETGILRETDRVELVGGEITAMPPIGTRHAACVGRLTMWLSRLPGRQISQIAIFVSIAS